MVTLLGQILPCPPGAPALCGEVQTGGGGGSPPAPAWLKPCDAAASAVQSRAALERSRGCGGGSPCACISSSRLLSAQRACCANATPSVATLGKRSRRPECV